MARRKKTEDTEIIVKPIEEKDMCVELKGDFHDIYLFQVLFQHCRKREIPVWGCYHDGFRFRKLPRKIKKRVLKIAFRDEPVAHFEKIFVYGGEFDFLQPDFLKRFIQF